MVTPERVAEGIVTCVRAAGSLFGLFIGTVLAAAEAQLPDPPRDEDEEARAVALRLAEIDEARARALLRRAEVEHCRASAAVERALKIKIESETAHWPPRE